MSVRVWNKHCLQSITTAELELKGGAKQELTHQVCGSGSILLWLGMFPMLPEVTPPCTKNVRPANMYPSCPKRKYSSINLEKSKPW